MERQNLNIALAQADLAWENKAANFAKFEALFAKAEKADLILLPEMFTTGFTMNPAGQDAAQAEMPLWDDPEGETLQWMQTWAANWDTAICGSVIIKENGNFYNRLYFVHPHGDYSIYDKKHLFTLAGEEKVYSAGQEHLIVEFRGWRIMPLVCYDLRFPVWCRNTEEADLQLFVANWPERRADAWSALLKARAIENMCAVAGLNRVGSDGNNVLHSGNSEVFDELGNSVLHFENGEEAIKTVELDYQKIHASRERFGFLRDRDYFKLS